jgi:hypothetical protein
LRRGVWGKEEKKERDRQCPIKNASKAQANDKPKELILWIRLQEPKLLNSSCSQ